jgi:hypothetical protein
LRTSPATCRSASIASFKTWRAAVSAARSDCLQRRKSARHIDESESSSSGWPTPQTMNRKSRKAMTASTENGRRSGGGNSSTPGLEQAVEMSEGILPKELKGMSSDQVGPATRCLWPTPDCTMRPHEGNVRMLRKAVDLGMPKEEADAILGRDIAKPQGKLPAWPTPRASTGGPDPESRATGKNLQNAVASCPTPMARDHKDGDATANVPTNGHLGRAAPRDPTSHPGQLNPDWVEMLMGFPIGWTASELSGTR